jgi:hypothetical protein
VSRRVVKVRRVFRPQAAIAAQSPAQNFALTPTYQSIPDATAPQAVRRRVVVKRHRSVNKTAAQVPAARPVTAN